MAYKISKKAKKKTKKIVSKFSSATKIVACMFFALCLFCGVATTYFITKNDTFEIIGELEVEINLGESYEDQGVKIIAFGKDISDQVEIIGEVDTTFADDYVIKYKVNNIRFLNYTLYRKVTVKGE